MIQNDLKKDLEIIELEIRSALDVHGYWKHIAEIYENCLLQILESIREIKNG